MNKIPATLTCLVAMAVGAFAGEYPDISIKELKSAIAAKKVTVIDVNGPESYAKGHIPTAVDFSAKSKELAKVLPKDKKALVVAYCGGPTCNAYQQAAAAVEKMGYTNVKHLSAGISGWMQAGEKTEKAKASEESDEDEDLDFDADDNEDEDLDEDEDNN